MYIKYLAGFLCMLLAIGGHAQTGKTKSKYGSYYFDGDDVVFEFDRRSYEKAIRSSDSAAVDFADLDIAFVAVSGNFNDWSKEGWSMQRVDANRFRLRKKLKDFTDTPNWQFRFVINGQYWANTALPKKQGALGLYNITNPNVGLPVKGTSDGYLFRLEGFMHCNRVILAGTFNGWDEEKYRMKRVESGWELRLPLPPGEYEYKFIADGQWMHDPANPLKKRNEHNTYNSILRLTKDITFELRGYTEAQEVILSGSFNDWNKKRLKMHRTEAGWAITVPLIGGKHLYKFIVDGNWITDPSNRRVESTWDGYVNSVLFVR